MIEGDLETLSCAFCPLQLFRYTYAASSLAALPRAGTAELLHFRFDAASPHLRRAGAPREKIGHSGKS